MKGVKGIPNFTTKLSQQLAKFKDSSTVSIAHDQIRKIFAQYTFVQIATQFANKMDSCDRLSDRQKKQYAKLYITLIQSYGAQVLLEQYYERIMESLCKKTVGVGEVLGYLCKNLLSRIYPAENIIDYVNYLLVIFKNHNDISKIIKNIVQSIDSNITIKFQTEILSILTQKMNAKNKIQPFEALLAVIFAFQSNFEYQQAVQNLIVKYYKNDDYNVRAKCVDVCHALMVIREQVNPTLYRIVKQLKYDKIKHVRDAVGNYNALYKQIYGDQQQNTNRIDRKSVTTTLSKQNQLSLYGRQTQGLMKKSDIMTKTIGKKYRNEDFFQNAKQSDVIIAPQQNKSVIVRGKKELYQEDDNDQDYVQSLRESLPRDFQIDPQMFADNFIKKNHISDQQPQIPNFKDYLKKRQYVQPINNISFQSSAIKKQSPQTSQVKVIKNLGEGLQGINQIMANQAPKKTLKVQSKKRSQINEQKLLKQENINNNVNNNLNNNNNNNINNNSNINNINNNSNNNSNSIISNNKQIKQIHKLMIEMQRITMEKLQNIQIKIDNLDKKVQRIQDKLKNNQKDQRIQNGYKGVNGMLDHIGQSCIQEDEHEEDPEQEIFNEVDTPVDKLEEIQKLQKKQHQQQLNEKEQQQQQSGENEEDDLDQAESNLLQKLRESIKQQNWDEAYSLVLANHTTNLLLQLLETEGIPNDKIVQQCLVTEVRKLLAYTSALKWLKNYISQRNIPMKQLIKFKKDIDKIEPQQGEKGYTLLKSMVLKQIQQQLDQ